MSAVWARRGVLAVALLGVAFVSAPGGGTQAAACARCNHPARNAERWARPLAGQWLAIGGVTGTVPRTGQAYTAVGGGLAALANGLDISAYALADGKPLWITSLAGFPSGAAITSLRAWSGVITAGVALPAGGRTEVLLDARTGSIVRSFPAATFGGAVSAGRTVTVIVGARAVTSYDNRTGKQRWQFPTDGPPQAWRVDGNALYMAQADGGYLGGAPVTAVRRLDLRTGAERTLLPPSGSSFDGTLSIAAAGVLLFSGVDGVTAYEESTARQLWFIPGTVPEGDDPTAGRVYLTQGNALLEVNPATGHVRATAAGSASGGTAGMYVVRAGVALGLDQGAGGEAWGFDVAAERVIWTASSLPWPHYFADPSGIGGSAAPSGTTVVITACAKLAPPPQPSPSASPGTGSPGTSPSATSSATSPAPTTSASPSPTPAPTPLGQSCATPELVALNV